MKSFFIHFSNIQSNPLSRQVSFSLKIVYKMAFLGSNLKCTSGISSLEKKRKIMVCGWGVRERDRDLFRRGWATLSCALGLFLGIFSRVNLGTA